MARVNIEECWWSDPRRTTLLLAIGFEADSAAVNMWRTAQEFWGKGRGLIPYEVFFKLKHAQALIDSGLADVRDRSVYVRGCSERLEWFASKVEQASNAGKKSAEARKRKDGSAQPLGGKGHKYPNEIRTESNGTEPSLSYSSSLSSSNSNSESSNFTKTSANAQKAKRFIAAYCDRFKLRWGLNAEIKGKEAGIAKRLAKDIGEERLMLYLDAFFAMPDAWLVKTRHPLAAFETKLNEIVVFAGTGNFMTQRQVHQADDSVSNMVLLQQVREGKA